MHGFEKRNMIEQLNYAYGMPQSSGVIKSCPDDFFVSEILGYPLSGEGEHLYIRLEKKLMNTEEMAKLISRTFHLSPRQISYAGLKDKFATTEQWFSLHMPGQANPEIEKLNSERVRVLDVVRHNKKLQKGALSANQFKIKVQDMVLNDAMEEKISQVEQHGVPNYFGGQRFGRNGNNILEAKSLLLEGKKIKNRHLKGMYYSTARSYLFNHLLSHRVGQKNWHRAVDGDLLMLRGTNSFFKADDDLVALNQRIIEKDISPALVLWGKGDEKASDKALFLQEEALAPYEDWCVALEQHDLRKAYRQSILFPESLVFYDKTFEFTLPKGTYATVLLREILQF